MKVTFGQLILLSAILLAACSASPEPEGKVESETLSTIDSPGEAQSSESVTGQADTEIATDEPDPIATVSPPATNRRVPVEDDIRIPFLLPFDGIRPVYNPEFAPADSVPLRDSELVIGITLGGEAKAYPITVLRFREMVNDELGGIPILVTW